MSNFDLNWADLRSINGSQQNGFEELCCQLVRYEDVPVDSKYFRKGTPDAGVECYWMLPNKEELVWQAKFFRSPPQKSQWNQITKSIKRCIERHSNVRQYTVCIPLDRGDPRESNKEHFMDKWNQHVTKWEKLALEKLNRKIIFNYWGESEIIQRLSQEEHRGEVFFWFKKEIFTNRWFKSKLREALVNVGEARYSRELNIKLPIAMIFDNLGRTSRFLHEINIMAKKLELLLNEYEYSEFKFSSNEALDESTHVEFRDWVPPMVVSNYTPTDGCFRICMNKIFEIFNHINEDFRNSIDLDEVYDIIDYWIITIQFYEKKFNIENLQSSNLKKLINLFVDIKDYFFGPLGKLINYQILLVRGEAGIGKTHLFCDVADERLDNDLPTILLLGMQFTLEEPWTQIKRILDFNCTTEEFLQALDCCADLIGSRVLLLIDGLNDSKTKEIWINYLAGMIQKISDYPGIGLALSVRNEYERLIVPPHIYSNLVDIEHFGFDGMDESTFHNFFNYYNLEAPSFPILIPEFRVPLFLKILCKNLQNKGLRNIPRGHIGLTSLFMDFINILYIEKLYRPEYLNSNPNINYLKKAVIGLSKIMSESKSKYVLYEAAFELVNNILDSNGFENSLFRYMETEGIIQVTIVFDGDNNEKYIKFTYDKFTDFLIADYLLDKFKDIHGPQECIESSIIFKTYIQNNCTFDWGVINSLAIILPEKFDIELVNMINEELRDDNFLLSFLQSLVWRESNKITRATIDIIKNSILTDDELKREYYYILWQLITIVEHPLNANYLYDFLNNYFLAERDKNWTILINQEGKISNILRSIIDWLWFVEHKVLIPIEVLKLYCVSLPWIFSSSNPYLRDKATKALVSIISDNLSVLTFLFNKFHNVNDLYVLERVLAVIYGCCLRSKKSEVITEIALKIYRWAFLNKNLPQHLLIRDYCRQIIELALNLDSEFRIEKNKITPPFSSDYSQLDITDDVRADLTIKRDDMDYNSLAFSIFEWDFARYVIGTNSISFPWSSRLLTDDNRSPLLERDENFNLEHIQYWIFNKALELGWTPESFREHDSRARQGHYRYRFTERIGKKYQMIAYYMVLAIISDNYEFINEVDRFPQQVGRYHGPWQLIHGRDIDPSCLLSYQDDLLYSSDESKWWYPFIHNKWNVGLKDDEWMRDFNDLPKMKENIEIINPIDKNKWLVLEGLYEWRDSVLFDPTEWDLPHRTIWMKLKSYIVRNEDFIRIYNNLKDKNFMGNWMPSLQAPSDVFMGEFYWGIPYIEKYLYWFGRFDWTSFDDNLEEKILPTTDYYISPSWRDFSIEGFPLRILLLHRILKDKLNVEWNLAKMGFYDNEGTLIAHDVSYHYDKPDIFIINKQRFIDFLRQEDLNIFWIAYGNKHIGGEEIEDRNIRYDINGLFWLKNNKIQGKLDVIEVFYPSMDIEFQKYKRETGRNAKWKGKMTKKFKQWYYNNEE